MTWPDPGTAPDPPRVLTGAEAEDVLAGLERAGLLTRRPSGRRVVTPGRGEDGQFDQGGRHYLVAEVPGMVPLYRELYGLIFARRLALWGLRAQEDVGVLVADDLIVSWGPPGRMRARSPARLALERVEAGDGAWVEALEERWVGAAAACEAALNRLWAGARGGQLRPEVLAEAVARKADLAAWAVDALIPPRARMTEWYAAALGDEGPPVLGGSLLPASGFVAYDRLEEACWRLAAASAPGPVPEAARRRFVQDGLFYLYRTLEPGRGPDLLGPYVRQTADRYRAAAPGAGEIGRHLAERPWRRRLHHAWAREQLAALPPGRERERLLTLHRLLGTARDFDEEKRRLNMPLWRALFALTGALGVSLADGEATLEGLGRALERRGGRVELDPVFT